MVSESKQAREPRSSSEPRSSKAQWSVEVHRLLREIAARHLRGERVSITLQPTDLVHEAYLRLQALDMPFDDMQHFVRTTSTMMRRVLVDHARKKCRQRRGGRPIRVTLRTADMARHDDGLRVLELDLLLTDLGKADPRKARIAEVYYFAGLTQDETAKALALSPSTVVRELRFIKSWLHSQLVAATPAAETAPA